MILCLVVLVSAGEVHSQPGRPLLDFPQEGVDDPSAYRHHRTRFYRDSDGNAVQIILRSVPDAPIRLIHVWANALNESIAFSVASEGGREVKAGWGHEGAETSKSGPVKTFGHSVILTGGPVTLGHWLLGSMRKERDFQYLGRDTLSMSLPFYEPELIELIGRIDRQDHGARQRFLRILKASSVEELRNRMNPQVTLAGNTVTVRQQSFDANNVLEAELQVQSSSGTFQVDGQTVLITPARGDSCVIRIFVKTDAPSLTPLRAQEILNEDALASIAGTASSAQPSPGSSTRLNRQITALELLSYEEKLLAGLPNYGTYFGRDIMMSALMMEPIWTPRMKEIAISSVLRKLSPGGEVSHEESLGGQAIRENAAAANRILSRQDVGWLEEAASVLSGLRRTREDYKMIDDDFQLPVLVSRYLSDPTIPAIRKRDFLSRPVTDGGPSGITLIARNMAFVLSRAEPYARSPVVANLISFPPRGEGRWLSGSWRDSNAGYANGRFAYDVNAIWVPKALESVGNILKFLRTAGISFSDSSVAPSPSAVVEFWDTTRIGSMLDAWRKADDHFTVVFGSDHIRKAVARRIQAFGVAEMEFWMAENSNGSIDRLSFPALSLDSAGIPIPVMHSDLSTEIFLASDQALPADGLLPLARLFVLPYPIGLFVPGIGPLCANDAFADPQVWHRFEADQYHSPRVVWGREVNLLLLGLYRSRGKTGSEQLADVAERIRAAVAASGLQHNELWSYAIEDEAIRPVRYGTSTDIQLWNVTDLAVEFVRKKRTW